MQRPDDNTCSATNGTLGVNVSMDTVSSVARTMFRHCRAQNWAGYDPYDALNTPLIRAASVLDTRAFRLMLTQALKRSPINLRPLLSVPKTQNAKGIALFLTALTRAPQIADASWGDVSADLVDVLVQLKSSHTPYWAWGYSFPWQTRTILVPRGAPNLVCTVFVASALLELYQQRKDAQYLEMAESAAWYILKTLYWTDSNGAGFAYPSPSVRIRIHNANFLAAALLTSIYKITGGALLVKAALSAARYSASRQRPDGSWFYGDGRNQNWIDNFHTGFNLCAIEQIRSNLRTDEFEPVLRRGYDFYSSHFIRSDGAAPYYHDRTHPIDTHAVAQAILTLLTQVPRDRQAWQHATNTIQWALDHIWDERGYFYYRVVRGIRVRIPYMRWSQAWMALALATYLRDHDQHS